jgi:hypothetical protein
MLAPALFTVPAEEGIPGTTGALEGGWPKSNFVLSESSPGSEAVVGESASEEAANESCPRYLASGGGGCLALPAIPEVSRGRSLGTRECGRRR